MNDNQIRFWVVGGEYLSTEFADLIDGTALVLGPYSEWEDARRVWKHLATATRSSCCTRYSIAEERVR